MSEQNSEPSRPFDPPVPPTAPPAPPVAPPAPPAPPAPEVPQYGEYAPIAPANPYGVPVSSAPSAPAAPQYGAPAYGAPAYGTPAYGAPAYAPAKPKRRVWDVVLTSILLVLGLFGLLAALAYAAIFADPGLLSQTLQKQGYGGFAGSVGAAPAVLAVSHIVLFLLAAGLSIPLLIRGKIVVFWIPLVIGVIAAIIFWVVVISVIASDPAFLQRYGG